jgi:hypothetical protein
MRAPQGGFEDPYRNPRRPGEAGMKLVADQSQRTTEKEILEGLGFTVIRDYACALRSGAPSGWYFAKNIGG